MTMESCYCCEGTLTDFATSSVVAIERCRGCGSLVTSFADTSEQKDPWEMGSVTASFLDALKLRRDIQARQVVNHFYSQLQSGKVLDYGCGQGAFVSYMRERGIDAAGCDISKTHLDSSLMHSFVQLDGPWAVPDLSSVRTICFMDVLEHVPDPGELVSKLHVAGVDAVLVKVPMLHGPIGMVSQVLAKFGRLGLLRRLLLVDEISPHYSFFTSKGLVNLFSRNGFKVAGCIRLADVGSELPKRLRGKDGEPTTAGKDSIFTALGCLLAAVSPLWSDTRVFLFRRRPS